MMVDMDWQSQLSALKSTLPQGEGTIQESTSLTPQHSVLEVVYERKGRAGKPATIIVGFADDAEAKAVSATLKTRLGVGGSSRGGEILLQGDQRSKLKDLLNALGYRKIKGLLK